jgi:hypothetical protein
MPQLRVLLLMLSLATAAIAGAARNESAPRAQRAHTLEETRAELACLRAQHEALTQKVGELEWWIAQILRTNEKLQRESLERERERERAKKAGAVRGK